MREGLFFQNGVLHNAERNITSSIRDGYITGKGVKSFRHCLSICFLYAKTRLWWQEDTLPHIYFLYTDIVNRLMPIQISVERCTVDVDAV